MKRALALTGLTVAVALAASGAGARAASSACPTSNPPNELVLAGGSGQQAQLGKPFAQNLQVALANTNGCPLTGNLAGVTVNFDAPGSGASGIFASSGSREGVRRDRLPGSGRRAPVHGQLHRRQLLGRCALRLRHGRALALEHRQRAPLVHHRDGDDKPGGDRQRRLHAAAAGARHRCQRQPRAGRRRHVRDRSRLDRRERELPRWAGEHDHRLERPRHITCAHGQRRSRTVQRDRLHRRRRDRRDVHPRQPRDDHGASADFDARPYGDGRQLAIDRLCRRACSTPVDSRSKARPSPSRSPPRTTAPPRASSEARPRQPRSPTATVSPPHRRSSPTRPPAASPRPQPPPAHNPANTASRTSPQHRRASPPAPPTASPPPSPRASRSRSPWSSPTRTETRSRAPPSSLRPPAKARPDGSRNTSVASSASGRTARALRSHRRSLRTPLSAGTPSPSPSKAARCERRSRC